MRAQAGAPGHQIEGAKLSVFAVARRRLTVVQPGFALAVDGALGIEALGRVVLLELGAGRVGNLFRNLNGFLRGNLCLGGAVGGRAFCNIGFFALAFFLFEERIAVHDFVQFMHEIQRRHLQ